MKCGHIDNHVSVTPNSVTEAFGVTGAWGLASSLNVAHVAPCSRHDTSTETFFALTEVTIGGELGVKMSAS